MHVVASSDNFVYTGAIFLFFVKKMQNIKIDYVHCPMRKFWRPSFGRLERTMWESPRIEIPE